MRSSRDGVGLALLRLEALDKGELRVGDAVVTAATPAWMRLQQ
jgi:hypothetical protein